MRDDRQEAKEEGNKGGQEEEEEEQVLQEVKVAYGSGAHHTMSVF